jgi:transposase
MSQPQLFGGLDVATAQLDMAVRPTGDRWAVTHEETGIAALVAPLQTRAPTLMVLEATGGDQRAVGAALAAGLPVVVVNPRQARDVAQATGQLAKTDGRDARTVAHVAAAVRPPPRPLPDAPTEERRALLARAPATRRHADGGTAPPRRGVPAPAGRYPSPDDLARHTRGDPR